MTVIALDHRGIRTSRLEATRHFYEDVLGLENGYRPSAFDTKGYWLYAGEAPIIHLVEDEGAAGEGHETQRESLTNSGGDNHIALACSEAREVVDRLIKADIPYWDRLVKKPLMYQVFVEDPNGILVELIDRNPGEISGPIHKVVD